MYIGVWIYVSVFNLIPLINMSVFVPIPRCFYYCSSIVELEIRDGDTSRRSFFVQDCFSYLGLSVFPYEVESCSFKVCEDFLRLFFDGDELSL